MAIYIRENAAKDGSFSFMLMKVKPSRLRTLAIGPETDSIMTPLQYQFDWKTIWEEEPKRATMVVQKPFAMLSDIANSLSTLGAAKEALKNTKKVVDGKDRKFEFGSDQCMLEVYKRTTKIHYCFGESTESIETAFLLGLLKDWVKFLSGNLKAKKA